MMKLTILGASGHGKVVADIARMIGFDQIEFLDDNASIKTCGEYPVIGDCNIAKQVDNDVFIAFGNTEYRKKYFELLSNKKIPILIHPDAVIAKDAIIGQGSVIMAGAVVNPGSSIGRGCIVNTCSSIDHDCNLENFVHLAVGAHLCGTVNVGEGTWIGAGSIVSNNISICPACIIGAGAVVVRSITQPGTYIGVPARLKM